MIKRIIILALSVITIAFGQKEFGKITLPLGRVQVQKGGTGAFKKALPRMSINEKDIIKTLAKSEITEANVKPMEKNFGATLKRVMSGWPQKLHLVKRKILLYGPQQQWQLFEEQSIEQKQVVMKVLF